LSTGAINVTKNKYHQNPKEYRIYTPLDISYFIYEFIGGHGYNNIIDICCGDGSLSVPFQTTAKTIVGIDTEITGYTYGEFIKYDFIKHKRFNKYLKEKNIDLVLCNPPWNHCDGRKLYPYEFLKKIIEVFDIKIPIVLFTPMGLRLNRRYGAKRGKKLKALFKNGLALTSNISMPIDAFCPGNKKKGQQWEILIFNIHGIPASYWYTEEDMEYYKNKAQTENMTEWLRRDKHELQFGLLHHGNLNKAQTLMPVEAIEHQGTVIYQGSFLPK